MSPIHPGEHLAEFLEEYGISQYRLAREIHVSARRINEIVHGKRAITADTALRLGRFFSMEPGFWMKSPRWLRDSILHLRSRRRWYCSAVEPPPRRFFPVP